MEHFQHAMGDEEATGNIDCANEDGDRTENGGEVGPLSGELQDAANDDDTANGIGDAHERRMQRWLHIPNHLPTDEAGEHKDGEVGEE